MRFLILGCNGMAGHAVSIYLKEKGHDVVGFARRKSQFIETVEGDAREERHLKKIILEGRFDSIINSIGMLNQNAESNRLEAVFLNSYLPHFLEAVTKDTEIQVIQISTDCVFSGEKGDYSENALKDGRSFYARSKALGELENEKDFTLRTSIIGPDLDSRGIGLLNWFMQQRKDVYGYLNVTWTGLTTLQLAKCIEYIAEERLHGLYNVVPLEKVSKYELLVLCNDYLRNGAVLVHKLETPVVNKSLLGGAFNSLYRIPEYKEMIEELAFWMNGKERIYMHYRDMKIRI